MESSGSKWSSYLCPETDRQGYSSVFVFTLFEAFDTEFMDIETSLFQIEFDDWVRWIGGDRFLNAHCTCIDRSTRTLISHLNFLSSLRWISKDNCFDGRCCVFDLLGFLSLLLAHFFFVIVEVGFIEDQVLDFSNMSRHLKHSHSFRTRRSGMMKKRSLLTYRSSFTIGRSVLVDRVCC